MWLVTASDVSSCCNTRMSPRRAGRTDPGRIRREPRTHDMPTFTGFLRGRDIETRRELGLIEDADVERERQARGISNAPRAIAGACGPLERPSSDEALLEAVVARPVPRRPHSQPDDLLGSRAANVPGTSVERPNWRRVNWKTLEEIFFGGVELLLHALHRKALSSRRKASVPAVHLSDRHGFAPLQRRDAPADPGQARLAPRLARRRRRHFLLVVGAERRERPRHRRFQRMDVPRYAALPAERFRSVGSLRPRPRQRGPVQAPDTTAFIARGRKGRPIRAPHGDAAANRLRSLDVDP